MIPLPRSLDDIEGLRAARWIRESTKDQFDRYGPASQREKQDIPGQQQKAQRTCHEKKQAGRIPQARGRRSLHLPQTSF